MGGRALLGAGLLGLMLGGGTGLAGQPTSAVAQLSAAQPVLVRLGTLLWVYARSGLPTRVNGRTLVPLKEGCELLGLDCQAGSGAQAQVGDMTFTVQSMQGSGPMIELSALAAAAQLPLSYDPASRMAVLPIPDSLAVRSLTAELNNVDTTPSLPIQPLTLTLGAVSVGSPARRLSLNLAGAGRYTLTLAAAVAPSTTTLTGDGLRGSADVKPAPPACAGSRCTVGLDRNSSYALAILGMR